MNYHNITYPDMNNGDGLRVVLWLSGCNHRCKGCQNPQTWDTNSGIPFDKKAEEELFRELNKDYISGLTLSGGDPLHENNLDGVLNLINKIRLLMPEKTIWLYTGYDVSIVADNKIYIATEGEKNPNFEDYNKRMEIVSMCDVLVEGKYMDSLRDITLKWRGSSNQLVVDVKKSLEKGTIILWN